MIGDSCTGLHQPKCPGGGDYSCIENGYYVVCMATYYWQLIIILRPVNKAKLL